MINHQIVGYLSQYLPYDIHLESESEINCISTAYHINYISYQLHINYISTTYQLHINYISTTYQLYIYIYILYIYIYQLHIKYSYILSTVYKQPISTNIPQASKHPRTGNSPLWLHKRSQPRRRPQHRRGIKIQPQDGSWPRNYPSWVVKSIMVSFEVPTRVSNQVW